jgi:RNA polymerase sigma-70 factor (ECF subfamily)
MGGFRGDSSFSTWLYRIAVNAVVDSLRKRHPRIETAMDDVAEQDLPAKPTAESAGDLTLERLRIERAIAALSPGYRSVLVLHDVEGYSHEEISQWLGSSIGTCKSQLHKARRRMRELLSGG